VLEMFVVARYLHNKHCFNLTLIKSQRPTLYAAVTVPTTRVLVPTGGGVRR